jgi:hypothetical protein
MVHNSKLGKGELGDGWQNIVGIKSIKFYRNDVKVEYMVRSGTNDHERSKRKEVTEFTLKSREKLAFVANNTDVNFTHMITLTYPKDFESDGREVKRQLNRFLSWMRSKIDGVNYLWFLEFQRRGAPHFHILIDHEIDKREVSQKWYDHVGSGDEKHLRAGTNVERIRKPEGARRYCLKYAFKMEQKRVPAEYRSVGRFWGHSRAVKPSVVYDPGVLGVKPEKFVQAMDFWEYIETVKKRPLKTLYGASGNAAEILKGVYENE